MTPGLTHSDTVGLTALIRSYEKVKSLIKCVSALTVCLVHQMILQIDLLLVIDLITL